MSVNEKTRSIVIIQPESIIEFVCLQELPDLYPKGPDTKLKVETQFINMIWKEF